MYNGFAPESSVNLSRPCDTYIASLNKAIIGSNNYFSPVWHLAIMWIKLQLYNSYNKVILKMFGKWQLFCICFSVLIGCIQL